MKRKFKFLALLLTLILSVGAFSGCFLTALIVDEIVNKPEEVMEVVGEPEVVCTYDEESKMYNVSVNGIVKNNSEYDWDWVSISVMLYDADGNVLDSAYDSVDYIAANGSWRFCATAMTSYEVVSAKGYEFTGSRADLFV